MNLGPHHIPGIVQGDCRDILRQLPDGCIQTVITSPPYHGLRDYGVDGAIGLEPTLDEHIAVLVDVFREVQRVLRDDGTLWLNYGDRYNSSLTRTTFGDLAAKNRGYTDHGNPQPQVAGLHSKNLLGVPWRVAFALQADGWILRSDIIWCKPSPTPESVRDRPTSAHEHVFLFAKRPRYFYDADAVRVPSAADHDNGNGYGRPEQLTRGELGQPEGWTIAASGWKRNLWNYWLINSEACPDAHFATFPRKLAEPCILAGTSERGCCAECGAPLVRVVEREARPEPRTEKTGAAYRESGNPNARLQPQGRNCGTSKTTTTGWARSCTCATTETRPCIVLDPFGGTGTVGAVAEHHGRLWLLCELNPEYIRMARKKTAQRSLLPLVLPLVGAR